MSDVFLKVEQLEHAEDLLQRIGAGRRLSNVNPGTIADLFRAIIDDHDLSPAVVDAAALLAAEIIGDK